MAKNETIFFTKDGRFISGAGAALTNIGSAGIEGSKLLDLRVTDISGATAVEVQIDSVSIGTFSTPAIGDQLLNAKPVDKNGNPYLNLPASALIRFIPTGGSITVMAYLEDY